VDATFFCDFSNVRVVKPTQIEEEDPSPDRNANVPKKKKRKTNRGEVLGVDAMIRFDAKTNEVQQIVNGESKQVT